MTSGGARTLDGKAVAERIRREVAREAAALAARTGAAPGLSVVLVGEHPASKVYVRNKERAARKCGLRGEVVRLPETVSEAELLDTVRRLNDTPDVHGILVQLPLPSHIDESRIIQAIHPDKDVDGFHPMNAGRLLIGLPGLVPCTPAGILEMLKHYEIPLVGRRAVVLGRSNIVGKPMAVLLLREHCTVTVCHSRTRDLPKVSAEADILVVAIGRPGMVTAEYIKEGAVVVDVGIHTLTDPALAESFFAGDPARLAAFREKGSALVGDVHPAEARKKAGWLSPVPGGVGPLTIAMLLRNTVEAARRQLKGAAS